MSDERRSSPASTVPGAASAGGANGRGTVATADERQERSSPGSRSIRLGVRGRFLVPSGERRVVDWFFRDLFVPHGRRERLLRRAVRVTGRLPISLAWAFRDRHAADEIAADDATRAEALAAVRWLVQGPGRPLLAEGGVAACPSWLAAADYAGTGRRRTLAFLFAAGSGRPAAMAKLRPADAAGEPLATERQAIDRVRAELPAGLAATVPAVLAWRHAVEREGLLLAALPGRSVWADLHAASSPVRRAPRHLAAAADWLAAFHAATRRDQVFRLPAWGELAAGEPGPPSWYRRLEARLERRPLPLAAGHGDFWPRNVLMERGEVTAVVDWEAARPAAPPFSDLFAFAWSYGVDGPWRRRRPLPAAEAFRHAFLDDNPLSRAVAAYLARYGAALALDGATASDLFRLWLRTRQADDPEGGETCRICDRMLGAAERSAFSG